MSADKPEKGDKNKYHYFVDDIKYDTEDGTATGAQIKSRLPDFDPNYQLVLEGRGQEADRVIGDSETVSFAPPPPRFYTVPPANFG